MTNKERKIIKNKILYALTTDFKRYRRRSNQALFNKKEGYAVFTDTDLTMVMDAVVIGLELAKEELNKSKEK